MPESYYSDANCLTSKEVQFRRVNPCKWTSLPRQQDLVSLLFPRLLLSRSEKKTGDCFRLRIVYSTRKLFKFRISLKLLLPENRDVLARSRAKLDISSRASQFVFGRYWKKIISPTQRKGKLDLGRSSRRSIQFVGSRDPVAASPELKHPTTTRADIGK